LMPRASWTYIVPWKPHAKEVSTSSQQHVLNFLKKFVPFPPFHSIDDY